MRKRALTVPRVDDHSSTQDEDGVWLFFDRYVFTFSLKTLRYCRQTQP